MIPRKDYGCPLRIYRERGAAHPYAMLPPRSGRAMALYRNPRTGDWRGLTGGPWGLYAMIDRAGPHLGQRISWQDLPAEVQRFVRLSFLGEYCPTEAQS